MTYSLRPVPPAAVVTTSLAALTSAQQDTIVEGTLVTTSDTAERWQYTGSGDKTLAASYVLISDTTPDWSTITGRPPIPTAAPAAGQIMAGNAVGTAFATVSVSGDAALAATGALTISNNAVTNAKLAQAASGTLKGRTAAGTGDVSDLTASDVRTLLNVADGAEANVQANWTESNSAFDSFIQNKPTLGGAALLNVGTTTGTVAAGDDARLSDSRTPTAHTHAAADITSGTIDIARIPTGTGSTQVALGDHTHSQLHDRSHAMTGTSDHTAGNWQVFYSNGSGQVTELPLGASNTFLKSNGTTAAPSFDTVSGGGGGISAIGTTAADILSVSGSDLTADDPGADRLVFWDDSESKLTHLEVGTGLSISGTTLSVTGGGATNIFIPASAWIPRTSNGCGVDSRELATNDTNWDELLFDAGTDEFAQAVTILPNNYNLGTITARFYWTASTGSGDVIFGIQGRAFANDDALDTAFGTAQTANDTLIATNDMHITSSTSAVTIGGTPAANTPILFQIYRDADAGGDTLSSDARLLGVEILFN